MTLGEFEALVLSQVTAATPWQAVTDYSFEARKAAEGQHPQLIKDVFQPADVLDVGCGYGHLVRLLRDLDVDATGFDVVLPPGVSLAVKHAIRQDDMLLRGVAFIVPSDLVICREVLEHLTLLQVRTAVTNLCRLSRRFVYVTTRFSSEHDILRVDTSDDLDPTHITIASKDLYRLLFTLEGFKRRADLEEAMDWQRKNRCLVYERAV